MYNNKYSYESCQGGYKRNDSILFFFLPFFMRSSSNWPHKDKSSLVEACYSICQDWLNCSSWEAAALSLSLPPVHWPIVKKRRLLPSALDHWDQRSHPRCGKWYQFYWSVLSETQYSRKLEGPFVLVRKFTCSVWKSLREHEKC